MEGYIFKYCQVKKVRRIPKLGIFVLYDRRGASIITAPLPIQGLKIYDGDLIILCGSSGGALRTIYRVMGLDKKGRFKVRKVYTYHGGIPTMPSIKGQTINLKVPCC